MGKHAPRSGVVDQDHQHDRQAAQTIERSKSLFGFRVQHRGVIVHRTILNELTANSNNIGNIRLQVSNVDGFSIVDRSYRPQILSRNRQRDRVR